MSKSKAEIERLQINAQTQQILMKCFIKQVPKDDKINYQKESTDVYQPTGEIDYEARFSNPKTKAKKVENGKP